MRELKQRIEASGRRRRAEHEARLAVAALQTAELVNIVGALGAGKGWKPVRPLAYFEAWTGAEKPADALDDIRRRMAEADAAETARNARRAIRDAGTQQQSDPQGE